MGSERGAFSPYHVSPSCTRCDLSCSEHLAEERLLHDLGAAEGMDFVTPECLGLRNYKAEKCFPRIKALFRRLTEGPFIM